MKDKRQAQEDRAKKGIPFLLCVVFVGLAFLSNGGFWAALFVLLAFLVGYLPAEKILFFVNGVENERKVGREALHRLSEGDIERINDIQRNGRKIEAIKELRAINNDGLREAKAAVELLEDFGLRWRQSEDKPITDRQEG